MVRSINRTEYTIRRQRQSESVDKAEMLVCVWYSIWPNRVYILVYLTFDTILIFCSDYDYRIAMNFNLNHTWMCSKGKNVKCYPMLSHTFGEHWFKFMIPFAFKWFDVKLYWFLIEERRCNATLRTRLYFPMLFWLYVQIRRRNFFLMLV